MTFWNLSASSDEAGVKSLNIQIHGVIDGGWLDGEGTSSAEIASALAEHQDAAHIDTYINSLGGSLFGGIAVYNVLQAHPAARAGNLRSHVVGMAASAASLIAMAGKTVMHDGSMLMIHNPMAIAMGDAREMRRMAADLDKAQQSLLAVYKAKTGKDGTELRAMLDAETYLTAEQAVRQGFADEMAAGNAEVKAQGADILINKVAFPRDRVPVHFLNLLAQETPMATPNLRPPLTREILAAEAPALLAALLDEGKAAAAPAIEAARAEGHAAGVTAERARLQSIDDLGATGDLVNAAKYGETPGTAEALAVTLWKSQGTNRAAGLTARVNESAAAAGVKPAPTEQNRHAEETAAAKQIAAFANGAPRGGVR